MAARITPSAGPKPDKLLRDALLLELNQETETEPGVKVKNYRRIAANLVRAGLDNKMDAIREIWDRTEGKAKQEVDVHHEGELTLKSALISQLDSFLAEAASGPQNQPDAKPLPN